MKKQTTKDKENLPSSLPKPESKKEPEEEPKEITLEYKLHELPSSQHKAGLAGLYLIIDWLDKQNINKDLIKKIEISETSLKVTLTKQDLKDLFDEIYKLEIVETETTLYVYFEELKKKKIDRKTKEEIEPHSTDLRDGTNYYIYHNKLPKIKVDSNKNEIEPDDEEIIQSKRDFPSGSIIKGNDNSKEQPWLKIWREAQWLLRGDRQRLIYKNSNKEVELIWGNFSKDKKENDLSKVLFLSAQNNNAEKVDFKETNKNKFLLHFWVFAAQPYTYWTQRKDKDKYKTDEHGFIIAVPDIAKLESFNFIFNELIKNQDNEIKKYPIKRPEQAVVYLPSLAGLQLLKNIHNALKKKINSNYSDVVHGIDLFHYDYEWKKGKPKKNRASIFKGFIRIKPNIDLENKAINIKKLYRNFFFQKQLLQNLFEGKDELYDFYNLFCNREYEYFFNHWDGEFKPDAKLYFEEKENKFKGEQKMSEEDKIPKTIELLVYQIIKTYVYSKLESKHQIIWNKDKKVLWSKQMNAPANEDAYKSKSKIAKEAFLAMRSRKDKDDFITYFTSTICSVSQHLGGEGYNVLAESLYNKKEDLGWEKIRALSMLALSANS
ncbi:type I-MYXAN CRISPR-associated protein Cmx8 [Leptospira adleri]|uniref:Type I-MYXAN CRISPR-associated protein Cmx8 n=1 Tax=Leptospira adleri TaxID=2023186 RepID=A0ABX4NY58_9LEPT|nr:type I-MYXAN CRISPR-associated protein Cmx8 [Leptospira adleri]PJZ60801.1 type I-MYXAN CRISPR-associated protein Cmx8 [Leptospira adleri]